MFRSDTGADVLTSHTFGFPVTFTVNGSAGQGYYGAWQGRHSLWLNGGGGTLPDGTSVTSQDPNRPGTYLTASFTGTLTKRTLKAADISDLLDLPVEIWANFQHNLRWDGSQWTENNAPFTDFASLVAQPRMNVMITRWSMMGGQANYVYDPSGPAGPGFYLATMGQNNTWTRTSSQCYQPSLDDSLWASINGSIYIEYQGGGAWVQKKVTAFDMQTNTPTFDPAGDVPYSLTTGLQYYINKQGGNYVVTQTGPGAFDVQVEIQTAANPVNVTDPARAAELLGAVATFRPQWGSGSTFRFDRDPASPTFMKLLYATVASPDTAQAGDPVTTGQWGLAAYDGNGQSLGVQYNWDYPQQGQTYGAQTFLYTVDAGQNRTYKLLDDPIALAPATLQTTAGVGKTLSLQFDGWMQGLPQFYDELARNELERHRHRGRQGGQHPRRHPVHRRPGPHRHLPGQAPGGRGLPEAGGRPRRHPEPGPGQRHRPGRPGPAAPVLGQRHGRRAERELDQVHQRRQSPIAGPALAARSGGPGARTFAPGFSLKVVINPKTS